MVDSARRARTSSSSGQRGSLEWDFNEFSEIEHVRNWYDEERLNGG